MGNRKTEKIERSIGIDSLKSVIRALDTAAFYRTAQIQENHRTLFETRLGVRSI